jgi:hypothetical protein
MESALSAAMSFVERFRTTGYNLGLGLKSGLERSKDLAIQAAKLVAQAMLKKTREVFDTQSPSKKFEEIGMYNDMGLANGTKKYAYLVTKASEKVGNNALTSTSRILSNLSTLVNDDFNADPVIRPVVDMSNVTSGARSITGMLSGTRSLTVEATRTKALASSISVTPKREYQNGTASENQVAGSEGNNTLNLSGNNFYIREKQDIYDLASEFAILMNQGKQAYGAKA